MKTAIALLALAVSVSACATDGGASTSSASSGLAGRDWKLTELNGQPVAETNRPAHISFSAGDHRVSGSGGCNSFGGAYELRPGNRIYISQVVHTMMACQSGMDVDNGLMTALNSADSYTVSGNALILNSADTAAIAEFTAN